MIKDTDLLNIGYYEYGQPFYGSHKGMRYRLAREPLENVRYIPADKRGEASLRAYIWREPYSFDKTEEELKEFKDFEYSKEGLLSAIKWLNEKYESDYSM